MGRAGWKETGLAGQEGAEHWIEGRDVDVVITVPDQGGVLRQKQAWGEAVRSVGDGHSEAEQAQGRVV